MRHGFSFLGLVGGGGGVLWGGREVGEGNDGGGKEVGLRPGN